jgi:putative ABC transport system ATP-binding protein
MMEHPPALVAERIEKSYLVGGLAVAALRGVDLTVAKGELVALVGPSGCGKTTLLHLLGGLDRPSAGRVFVAGVELATLSDDALADLRRERLGFVFQTYNLFPVLSARENVEVPLSLRGASRAERRERATALLATVGLAERAEHRPSELSGGERQRVAIARALANRPEVILLDEPTGDLDSRTGGEVLALLVRLVAEQGTTLVVATHDTKVAAAAGRVVRMRDGRVESEGAP